MVILPQIIRRMYLRLVPVWIRKHRVAVKLKTYLPHDVIYHSDYFTDLVEPQAVMSAGAICDSILSDLKPRTVIDIGCGTGALLERLSKRGCHVFGLEYSEAALKYCRARQLNVLKFDLERDVFEDDATFDVAVSMDVAEHLPAKAADRYVDLLTCLSKLVVFTASPPGQGGNYHVNEQPSSYWMSLFQQRGYEHDEDLSQRWRDRWRSAGVVNWYYNNLMIFRKACET